MPCYDLACKTCGFEFEAICKIAVRNWQECPDCGVSGTEVLIGKSGKAPSLSLFQSGWFEDIGDEPIYCETPQQLREACDAHNARSVYLEDGVWKTQEGPEVVKEYRIPAVHGED